MTSLVTMLPIKMVDFEFVYISFNKSVNVVLHDSLAISVFILMVHDLGLDFSNLHSLHICLANGRIIAAIYASVSASSNFIY